jgi:hypothetical protein
MAPYSYAGALAAAQKVNWTIDDVIGGDKRLDFGKPFMPEPLAGVRALDFLSPDERRTLNHIRGLGYLVMFGLVEEFILPFVLDHARPRLAGDDLRTRSSPCTSSGSCSATTSSPSPTTRISTGSSRAC